MGEWLHLVSFDWFCFEDYLSFLHFEPVFVFRAEVSLLEAVYTWVLFLIHPTTLCLLTGEFSLFTSRTIINRWGPRTYILSFVFWLLSISIACFSVCLCLTFWFHGFRQCLPRFFLCVSCLCPRFVFCGYHKVCVKGLIDKMALFLMTVFQNSISEMKTEQYIKLWVRC